MSRRLLLVWDRYILEHAPFQASLVRQLQSAGPLSVVSFDSYIREKQILLSASRYSPTQRSTQVSRRRQFLLRSRYHLKGWLKPKPTTQLLSSDYQAETLLPGSRLTNLRRMTAALSVKELRDFAWLGVDLASHFCVDLSLDCKSSIVDIQDATPQHLLLRSLAYHGCVMLEALNILFTKYNSTGLQLLCTSVYSLDWICREYAQSNSAEHRFVIPLLLRPPTCRVYHTYCDDLFELRRQHNHMVLGRDLMSRSISFALEYLTRRLSPSADHRYSPLSTDVNLLVSVLSGLGQYDQVWSYFTNSPDELVSTTHAFNSSVLARYEIPWRADAFLTSEEQCLQFLAHLASTCNALLVIRHHPRLGPERRSPFGSTAYPGLAMHCERLQSLHPGHVQIIPPEAQFNSYELALLSNRVISFRGTMPLECSLLGIKPIVLAKDQGVMNYWITLHAEAAPSDRAMLLAMLTDGDECYSSKELARFLCEFYLLHQGGSIPLEDPGSSALLQRALHSGNSRDSSDYVADHESRPINSEELVGLVDSYLRKAGDLVAGAFLGGG